MAHSSPSLEASCMPRVFPKTQKGSELTAVRNDVSHTWQEEDALFTADRWLQNSATNLQNKPDSIIEDERELHQTWSAQLALHKLPRSFFKRSLYTRSKHQRDPQLVVCRVLAAMHTNQRQLCRHRALCQASFVLHDLFRAKAKVRRCQPASYCSYVFRTVDISSWLTLIWSLYNRDDHGSPGSTTKFARLHS